MSPAAIGAFVAGAAAAAAILDGAAELAGRRRRPRAGPTRWAGVTARALLRLGRRWRTPAPGGDLALRLEAAGSPLGLGVADAVALKAGAGLAGLLLAAPAAAVLPGRLPLLAAVALPAGGYAAPDWLVARRIHARARRMELELPDLLDLLRVSVEAGLPLRRALGEVGRRSSGVLAAEWRRAAAELELGLPRERVMAALVRRCPAPGMAVLSAALRRAERHGAPLGETLAAQAQEARTARARRLREQAARAAPKIQLVVALMLVPSVLLLVAAALVASLLPR